FRHRNDGFLAAARDAPAPSTPTAIFTYGTLMRGMRSHDILAPRVRHAHGSARIVGASLIHIDWYPGLVLSDSGSVHGELYDVHDVPATLEEFDSYEDFSGYDNVTTDRSVLAWTYIYLGDPDVFPLIPSGRWTGA
ncbi:MAG: gamma-glutamylcyclotransferase, partial [Deltaproteobacteria bacterium]|nr:gamma-glutamylcyclotransferase [Deltaproteobacteria bacterium]